jgi:tRNA (cmo5U34)-methyltransferase
MTKFTFATRDEGFDNHINASIRHYGDLWNDVLSMSQYFVEDDTNVVDIGCSTGKLLKAMIKQNTFAPRANYIGVEIEEDFYDGFDKDIDELSEHLEYETCDVRDYYFNNCSLVTSIFTLQFMPQRDRHDVIARIYDGLHEGGAFIFAEKTVAPSSRIHEIRTFTYYDFKRESFSTEDIMDKERTLRHMMKPNTRQELLDMVDEAGFRQVDSFWQNHAFTGFIAIK